MQNKLFDNIDDFDIIKREWQNMPEYNNVKDIEPLITVKIKFITKQDFDKFHELLKKHIYKERVFNGTQRNDVKSAWYPSKVDKKEFVYE